MTLEELTYKLAELKINLQVEIDKFLAEMVLDFYTELNISVFTEHVDFDGQKFISYSPKYAAWKKRKYPAKFTGERNFELTGNMKSTFKMFKESEMLYTIGWKDKDLEKLAGYNSDAAKQVNIIALSNKIKAHGIDKLHSKVVNLINTAL